MAKQIILGDEARQSLLKGVNILSNLVKEITLENGLKILFFTNTFTLFYF